MNSAKRACLAAAVVLPLAALLPPAAHAQRHYPMVCRGGGDMRVAVTSDVRRNRTRFEIKFEKGRAAYDFGRGELRPGECTWVDRPINPSEPSQAWIRLPVDTWVIFPADRDGNVDPGIVTRRSNRNAQEFANDILRLTQSEGLFTINATNSGNGYFWSISISEGA